MQDESLTLENKRSEFGYQETILISQHTHVPVSSQDPPSF